MVNPWKPTKTQLMEAQGKTVPDLIGPGLRVLFCGINPSLYSAAVGHHFARPGNRFWPSLSLSGFTPRLLSAFEGDELLRLSCGITNVVDRATATAAELEPKALIDGGCRLEEKVRREAPTFVAFLGIMAYRSAFGRPEATVGLQSDRIGSSRIWVLPNPSGLNAHYQIADLAKLFKTLKRAADTSRGELTLNP